MLFNTRSLVIAVLGMLLLWMYFQQRQLSQEIDRVLERSKSQEQIQIQQQQQQQQDLLRDQQLQEQQQQQQQQLHPRDRGLTPESDRMCANLKKENENLQRQLEETQNRLEQEKRLLAQQQQQQKAVSLPPAEARQGSEVAGVTVRKLDEAKFAIRWLKSLSDEERDHAILSVLNRSGRTPFEFPATSGTSWNCYSLSEEAIADTFTPFVKFATGSVCVFENLCFFDSSYKVIADATSHPKHSLSDGQRFNWPQCLNGAHQAVTVKKVESAEDFLSRPDVTWVDSFSWLITNSYQRHTAHWMETISQLFIARKYLGPEIIPTTKDVYLANHGDMFDWQKGTLLTSLYQTEEVNIHYADSLSRTSSNPICFRKAVVPGYQFYFFPSVDVGVAFKHHAYETLGLSRPTSIPKVITLASRGGKRSISNEDELVEYMKSSLPGIEVRVVKFGTMSFREQVTAMHDSGILVGIHGADLTNLMFLPVGAAILEVNPYRWYDNRFFGLAPVTGIEYFSYNCGKASCGGILLWCAQHEEITVLAKSFCRLMIPGLPANLIFECFKKYLHTQGIVAETVYALLCGAVFNLLLHYTLIYDMDLGFIGAPIALSITYISLPLFLLFFVLRSGCHKNTWYGWSSQALTDWGPFLRLGIPGLFMVCAEWWAAEIIALAAGFIGDNDLAAQSIVSTINSMVFMVPLGISVAVNTRVGNLLGGGHPDRAKKVAGIAILMNLLTSAVNLIFLLALRGVWGYLLTNDAEVAHLVGDVLRIYAIAQIFDGTQGVEGGILRGLGKQTMGSLLNVVSYYIVGVPLSLFLAFSYGYGIFGLWWGMCLGYFICAALYTNLIMQADWKKESTLAQERVKLELDKLKTEPEFSGSANHRRKMEDVENAFPSGLPLGNGLKGF